ncbi:MAG: c-type cytochrome [Rhizobiales bacterium]|nr:c-type cytochrome [Hyphomicrobiales bacterium]
MDSFELNKIMGAVLGTCLGVLSLNIAANAIFHPATPEKPGYEIAVPEKPAGDGEQKSAPAQKDPPIAELLAKADVKRGEVSHNKCIACHTFDKGGRNMVGPNLYGVIGREKGTEPGFNYSAAFKKAAKGAWTAQEISDFVKNPRAYIPGTSMTFAGINRASERADLILFLNSKSDNPKDLKAAAQAQAGDKPGEQAPAQGPADNQPK